MLTKSTQREIGDGDYGERAVCANSLLPSVCGVDGKNVLLTLVFSELPLLISPTPPSRRTLLTYSTETYSIWRGRKNIPHIGKRGTPCLEVWMLHRLLQCPIYCGIGKRAFFYKFQLNHSFAIATNSKCWAMPDTLITATAGQRFICMSPIVPEWQASWQRTGPWTLAAIDVSGQSSKRQVWSWWLGLNQHGSDNKLKLGIVKSLLSTCRNLYLYL